MKYIKLVVYLLSHILCSLCFAQGNEVPIIKNLNASVDEAKKVIVLYYELFDKEDSRVDIELKVVDHLTNENYTPKKETLFGDIGTSVSVGSKRRIEWKYPAHLNFSSISFELIADDKYKIDINDLINQVDTIELRKTVNSIYGERNGSDNGLENLDNARRFIVNSFKKNDVTNHSQISSISRFDFFKKMGWTIPPGLKNSTFNIQNIVGSIDGTEINNQTFILCAHYDTAPGSPGADDNGSGVAGVLEAARILSKFKFRNSIRFIAFDCEEEGFVGSRLYLSEATSDNKDLSRVINLDMIGYYSEKPNTQIIPEGFDLIFPKVVEKLAQDSNRGNFVISTADEKSKKFGEEFVLTAHKYVPKLNVVPLIAVVDGQLIEALASSDHAAFWEKDYQALHIGDGGGTRNTYIHTKDDNTDLINYSFMSNIIKATIANVIEFASLRHCSVSSCKLDVVNK